jgi:hypothetical protein
MLVACGRLNFDPLGGADARRDGAACDASMTAAPFADDFDDGVASAWGTDSTMNGATVGEVGGVLQLVLAPGAASQTARTSSMRNLHDTTLSIEVVQMVNLVAGAYGMMTLQGTSDAIGWQQTAGLLTVGQASVGTLAQVPWDPVQQRWWRIREAAGFLSFETSPDTQTWTMVNMTATPGFVSQTSLVLRADEEFPVANPGALGFDNLDLMPCL